MVRNRFLKMAYLTLLNITVSVRGTLFASNLCKGFIHETTKIQAAQPATVDNLRDNCTCWTTLFLKKKSTGTWDAVPKLIMMKITISVTSTSNSHNQGGKITTTMTSYAERKELSWVKVYKKIAQKYARKHSQEGSWAKQVSQDCLPINCLWQETQFSISLSEILKKKSLHMCQNTGMCSTDV